MRLVCGSAVSTTGASIYILLLVLTNVIVDVEVNYALFDAFIVLHGTDTMAYTASALSFMLEELGTSIVMKSPAINDKSVLS